jgi:hypothetical protein
MFLSLLSVAPLVYAPTTSAARQGGPHWRLRTAARVASMSEFGIEAVTSLAAATAAASGGSMSLLLPSTDLLRSKRPLGSSQLTRGGMSWITRESRWMAQNYLYFIEQETLGFISVSEEAELLALLRDRFSVSALRLHLQRRVAEAPPEAGLRLAAADVAAARAGAEVGSRHNPTVWAAFLLGVQHLLTERAQSLEPVAKVRREGGIGAGDGLDGSLDWRADVEWVLLEQIGGLDVADSAASLAAALPTGSVKPVRQGAAPPKPRQPPMQSDPPKQATISKQPPQSKGASTQPALQAPPAPAPPTPAPAQRPSKQPKQPKAQLQPAQLAQPPSVAEDRSKAQAKGEALAATVATVAAAGGRGGAKAVPQPNAKIKTEIKSEIQAEIKAEAIKAAPQPNAKQPLGRREVGAPTLQWLGTATERCAVEYLAMADQLGEAAAPKDEEQAMEGSLRALRARFGIVPLVRRVDEILTMSGPPPAAAAEHAERVRQHVPTVWASFSSAVRALLQIRYESSAALGLSATGTGGGGGGGGGGGVGSGGRWSNSSAWLLLREMYASSKQDKAFRWRVNERLGVNERQANRQRAANRQPAANAKESKSQSSAKAATKAEVAADTKAEVAAARAVAAATLVAAGEPNAPTLSASAYLAALALEAPPGAKAGEAWAVPSWYAADVDVPPLAPLPTGAPLPGSAALLAAVGPYTTRLSRLLRQEREAALELAEKAVAAADLDAGPEEEDEEEALVAAATGQEQATAAAALRKSVELRAEARLRQLRGVRLSNVQQVNGKLGPRAVITIAALDTSEGAGASTDRYLTKRRLPRSKLAVGDVVMVRPCARRAAANAILAEVQGTATAVARSQAVAAARKEAAALGRRLRGIITQQSQGTLTITLELPMSDETDVNSDGAAAAAASERLSFFNAAPTAAAADAAAAAAAALLSAAALTSLRALFPQEATAQAAQEAATAQLATAARGLLGAEVRLDWIGTDVTHARNLAALDQLQSIAVDAAERGKPAPALGMMNALLNAPRAPVAAAFIRGHQWSSEVIRAPVAARPPAATAATAAPAFPSFNGRLEGAQLDAVEAAISGASPVSVLQGPPGSGKSAVAVEIVQRAVAAGLRVLVCAPSNMAVDGLTLRLHAADPSMRLVRVGDPERIDAAALNLTADAAAGRRAPLVEAEAQMELRRRLDELRADQRMGPERKAQMRDYVRRNTRRLVQKRLARGSEEAMSDAQVLLCTTTAAADKCVLRVPTLDLVVLDEAAQATAPNAWVALLRGRRAVLLGDPQQLPPTLLSRDAAAAGLGTSLMEWAQQEQPGSATLLDTQWRMHAAIAAWSSAQFYGGRLRSHPSVATRVLADLPGISRNSLTASPLLGVSVGGGNSERRGANGEISNELEARAVVSHVASLLRAGVPASDVLVISPYGAQVALLRRLLLDAAATAQRPDQPTHALSAVEVATVDASQGREAEAVIVSLVRSNRRRAVGFLADARRLNVAVTRASRHLALVCDPSTVGSDPLLATLLDHVAALGEWRAPDVDRDP